jgi:phosphoglycerate dehydrogenase-like enzyme
MSWDVLVTARAFWVCGASAQTALAAAGCRVTRSPEPGPLPEETLIGLLAGTDAVIASSDPYTARLFADCPRLKVVSRCGVGYDRVDVAAATEAGVIVTTTPGAMTHAVADYTFGLILASARKIPAGDALMRSGGWGEYPGTLVFGKTLGLVGFGAIGRAVAMRSAGFEMRILAYDPAWTDASVPLPDGLPPVEFVGLEQLVRESDFVSIHAPAAPETKGMFDAAMLARMKPTAFLINTARGSLTDEQALADALRKGVIAGAAVDVYTQEPAPPDHPLRSAPNCVVTPHNAFNAVEAAEEMSRLSAENILSALRGERPAGILNPTVLERGRLRLRAE